MAQFTVAAFMVFCALGVSSAMAGYKDTAPRKDLQADEVAVTAPGNLDKTGTTYVLMNDISAPRTAFFLANNVTLNLNGHTITFADGKYEHVPNHTFDDGLKGWDVSKAPGAKVEDQHMIHPIVGKNVCLLPEGGEIVSPYVNLPEAKRAYYAYVLAAGNKQEITINVENEKGEALKCVYMLGGKEPGTPITGHCPLGGGGVVALFWNQPAGKYRMRVKAEKNNAVIGLADICPVQDVGVGICETTVPYAYHNGVTGFDFPAFFDYSQPGTTTPLAGIPVVKGTGTITVRNGVIKNGTDGAFTCGIQSTAKQVRLVVENVKIINSGTDANALQARAATLKDCRFEVNTPFIFNRHQHDMSVVLLGSEPSEVAGCDFIGGQGCLAIMGKGTQVHDCFFENHQTITNHYSIGCDCPDAKIFKNRFEPKTGSGIYVYSQKGGEIYDNTFKISASPPTNEYGQTDYSCSAIRISDYDQKDPTKGCGRTRVYRNKMTLIGKDYPGSDKKYLPVCYGVFMSVGAEQNYIYDNEIIVDDQKGPDGKGEVYAFHIGGSSKGGVYYGNKITANTTPIWLGTRYGNAADTLIYDNTIVKAPGAKDFPAVKVGWWEMTGTNIGVFSNKAEGKTFDVVIGTDPKLGKSVCDVGWTLTVIAAPGAEVIVLDKEGKEVQKVKADDQGTAVARLAQFRLEGDSKDTRKIDCSAYTVKSGDKEQKVDMTKDQTVSIK